MGFKKQYENYFGVAWHYDEDKKRETKVDIKTNFLYKDFGKGIFNAADVGNYHAGWTGTHLGIPQWLQRLGAGGAEQSKKLAPLPESIFSPPMIYMRILNQPYYGDMKADYYWNNKGMADAEKDMKDNKTVIY